MDGAHHRGTVMARRITGEDVLQIVDKAMEAGLRIADIYVLLSIATNDIRSMKDIYVGTSMQPSKCRHVCYALENKKLIFRINTDKTTSYQLTERGHQLIMGIIYDGT
jgi:predicted transcriptional regulator